MPCPVEQTGLGQCYSLQPFTSVSNRSLPPSRGAIPSNDAGSDVRRRAEQGEADKGVAVVTRPGGGRPPCWRCDYAPPVSPEGLVVFDGCTALSGSQRTPAWLKAAITALNQIFDRDKILHLTTMLAATCYTPGGPRAPFGNSNSAWLRITAMLSMV
jgi:hypothetical protein